MDKRKHPRKDSSATLAVEGQEHEIIDLSARGLCVRFDHAMEVGERVPFTITLPSGQRIAGRAQVRWAQPQGWKYAHGLEIVEIGALGRRFLAKHLNPYHFGSVELLDLSLQFAATVLIVLMLRAAVLSDPARVMALVEMSPYLLFSGALGLGFWVVFKR